MKLCEFFKKQFDNAKETAKHFEDDSKYLVEVSGYEKGSFEWFKELSKRYFGGGYFYHYEADGITRQQLKEAQEQGFIKYSYYSNWQARCAIRSLRTTNAVRPLRFMWAEAPRSTTVRSSAIVLGLRLVKRIAVQDSPWRVMPSCVTA